MRESFESEGTSTGRYRGGLYVTYCGREHPAVYLGVGRFILYSDTADENFTFPTSDGRYLLQTDLRDENLTRASEVRIVGVIRECYENVIVHDILEDSVIISTCRPRLAFQLSLKPIKDFGFAGIIDKDILIGMYEEHDYLWNREIGIYSTFCQAAETGCENTWLVNDDRLMQLYIGECK